MPPPLTHCLGSTLKYDIVHAAGPWSLGRVCNLKAVSCSFSQMMVISGDNCFTKARLCSP